MSFFSRIFQCSLLPLNVVILHTTASDTEISIIPSGRPQSDPPLVCRRGPRELASHALCDFGSWASTRVGSECRFPRGSRSQGPPGQAPVRNHFRLLSGLGRGTSEDVIDKKGNNPTRRPRDRRNRYCSGESTQILLSETPVQAEGVSWLRAWRLGDGGLRAGSPPPAWSRLGCRA